MSNGAFLWVFSRGIELGVIVLCLLPLRALLRERVPRRFSYFLWATIPVNIGINLVLKIIPNKVMVVDYINISPLFVVDMGTVRIIKWIWGVGAVFVLSSMVIRYIRLLRCLVGSVRMQTGIYVTDRIESPFTLGVFRPKIYLPLSLTRESLEAVILHERVHITRRDVWMKYLAIGILGLFWFQPILWFAYRLFINDMEAACDEVVLYRKGTEFCKEYAHSLLEVAFQANEVNGVVIGYGSGEIKDRIKHVMDYKRTGVTLQLVALSVCLLFMAVSLPISWQVPRLLQVRATTGVSVQQEMTVVEGEMVEVKIDMHDMTIIKK